LLDEAENVVALETHGIFDFGFSIFDWELPLHARICNRVV